MDDTMTKKRMTGFRDEAEEAASEQRRLQSRIDRRTEADGSEESDGDAVQAGARRQPENPLPEQHLDKPGSESDLEPRPRYSAPDYRGSGKLEGMNALVTGGDSGIGRAVAVLFGREGANVAITYLSEHADAAATKHAVEEEGVDCFVLAGDLRNPEFCEAAVERVLEEFGSLDILVNNAAFQLHVKGLQDLTDEHLDMTMRTNVYGYIQMARAAEPHLQEGGSIINTGSETGLFGHPSLLDYATTKGAIHALTMSLASHFAPRGIRVNCVAPGPVWTPLNPADKEADDIPEFGSSTPMKRPAQPEEIAPAYVFLAAPVCSSYISGAVLPVMGGPTGGA